MTNHEATCNGGDDVALTQFQSAPRDESRGDESHLVIEQIQYAFQSAPRDESRGDPRPDIDHDRDQGFNPRLVTNHEATARNAR